MITLHKLVPPENETLFERFPELNRIWEIPELQSQARESYEEWGTKVYPGESTGEIFSIDEDGISIGITGWFEYGAVKEVMRLRYHGIVPGKRGKGYGEEAIRLLLAHLSEHAPSHCLFLSESVSLGRTIAPKILAHFKGMGFVEFDDPSYGDNGFGKVQSLRIRIPGR